MSAFILDDDHFKALAIFATKRVDSFGRRVDPRYVKGLKNHEAVSSDQNCFGLENLTNTELAAIYATILLHENIRSVQFAYPNHKPIPFEDIVVNGNDDDKAVYQLKPVAILKMIDSLEYQSSETDDYHSTVAFELLTQIRKAAIRELPGYENAPWSYTVKVAA